MKKRLLVINGPNLDLLGIRERELYGVKTLEQIEEELRRMAESSDIELDFFQSNSESEIIEKIHKAYGRVNCIIINPAAFTHTSVAIRDALTAVKIPTIEVHLSNLYQREEFRHYSYIAPVAVGQITGFGHFSYVIAFYAARAIMDGII
ncbi:type II 3-dehydroquinate dehydratase [Candidatus Sumerlaeota bacterium]|nr:type II 3-dehydroquinate dehydratase [Candidatus Sumerlaeota bacterium]